MIFLNSTMEKSLAFTMEFSLTLRMIELGLFTGMRVDEIRQLKIDDLLIKGNQSSIIVQKGKGDKKRFVWINAVFKKTCQEFLKIRSDFGLKNIRDQYLLTSTAGESLSKRSLQKSFKRCIHRIRLSEKYSIHCLRHTYGTFLLKASKNIKLVKEQLGHASIKTTEIYISLIAEDTKEALELLYEVPIYKSKPKEKKPVKRRRRELMITDDFNAMTQEEKDEMCKGIAELMVGYDFQKDFE